MLTSHLALAAILMPVYGQILVHLAARSGTAKQLERSSMPPEELLQGFLLRAISQTGGFANVGAGRRPMTIRHSTL